MNRVITPMAGSPSSMKMNIQNKLKPQAARRPSRPKTKDDFLRWLKKRKNLEKLKTPEKTAEKDPEMKEALMVWVDDGGPPA